jgi:hypothetical protein
MADTEIRLTTTQAKRLIERELQRSISRTLLHYYIRAGDLDAVNESESATRPRWGVSRASVLDLIRRVRENGDVFPAPGGRWIPEHDPATS